MFRHIYRGYIFELTSVGVDVVDPSDSVYLRLKVSLEEAVMFVNREIREQLAETVDSSRQMP